MNPTELKRVQEIENHLYAAYNGFKNNCDPDCECGRCFPDASGLIYPLYAGGNPSPPKTYRAPMFEIKQDHADEGECRRCIENNHWERHWDEIVEMKFYIDTTNGVCHTIHFEPDTAAKRSHP